MSVYRTNGPLVYVLCFTRPRYQASLYRTIGPLVLKSNQSFHNLHKESLGPQRKLPIECKTRTAKVHKESYPIESIRLFPIGLILYEIARSHVQICFFFFFLCYVIIWQTGLGSSKLVGAIQNTRSTHHIWKIISDFIRKQPFVDVSNRRLCTD